MKARFSAPGQTGPGAHPASCTMCTLPLSAVKRQGRGVDLLPPSKVKVKERVQLYIYSRSGPSWLFPGKTSTLPPISACVYMTAQREKFVQLCAFHGLSNNMG